MLYQILLQKRSSKRKILIPVRGYIYPVGRLDYNSRSNAIYDSDFASRITHPRYGIEKEYLVKFKGFVDTPNANGRPFHRWFSS